jgi:hypothetical protein
VPLEIDTSINNQTVVSCFTHASPVALTTVNVTAITVPTGTTITTPGSESVSTSKRGGIPAGITKSIIEGRKALVADAMDPVDSATTTAVGAVGAIVVDSAPTVPTSDSQQNAAPSNAPPLDGGEINPFDVGTHLNMEVPALPLCFANEDESCSDDNSVFVDLTRD